MDSILAEFIGTTILMLLGIGVNANTSLKNTIGSDNSNWVLVSMAWGLSVFVAVFITGQFSGAHLNPAVTVGLAVAGKFSWSLVPGYIFTQLIAAMFGSWLAYVVYIDHYRLTKDEDTVRGSFCTGPAIRNYKNKKVRVINLYPSTLSTHKGFESLNKLDTENLAKMINWLIKQPQEIEIREMSIYCTTLEKEFKIDKLI